MAPSVPRSTHTPKNDVLIIFSNRHQTCTKYYSFCYSQSRHISGMDLARAVEINMPQRSPTQAS